MSDDWPMVDPTATWTLISDMHLEGEAAVAALNLDGEWRDMLGMSRRHSGTLTGPWTEVDHARLRAAIQKSDGS